MVKYDIVFVDFPFQTHDGRSSKHFAVVLDGNRLAMLCAQVTSKAQKYNRPTDYLLVDWNSAGLNQASIVKLNQQESFTDDDVIFTLGHLSDRDIHGIEHILQTSIEESYDDALTEAVDDFNFEVYIALSNLAKKYPNKTQADINKAIQIYLQNSNQVPQSTSNIQQTTNMVQQTKVESKSIDDIDSDIMNESFVNSFVESFKKNGNGKMDLSEEAQELNEECSNIPDEGVDELSEDFVADFVNSFNNSK